MVRTVWGRSHAVSNCRKSSHEFSSSVNMALRIGFSEVYLFWCSATSTSSIVACLHVADPQIQHLCVHLPSFCQPLGSIATGFPQDQRTYIVANVGSFNGQTSARSQTHQHAGRRICFFFQPIFGGHGIVSPLLQRGHIDRLTQRITKPVVVESQHVHAFASQLTSKQSQAPVRTNVLLAKGWADDDSANRRRRNSARRMVNPKQVWVGLSIS